MARILIIEDEVALAEALRQGLTDEFHVVDVAHDGEEGLWAARTQVHDLILLDLMLPLVDGMTICRNLRKERSSIPILMLTARDTLADVVRGLDCGANDFMTKPFSFEELLARIRALLRARADAATSVVQVADLRVDTIAHRAWRGDDELQLTAQEIRLLEFLALHAGQTVGRDRLIEALWERDRDPDSNVLEVRVSSLRRKLDRGRSSQLIHTVRGLGYSLREEPA